MRFKGKSVLITGAAGGFGRGSAQKFAAEGASLVLSDLNGEGLETAADELRAGGAKVETLVGDVSDPDHHKALVNLAVSTFGRLDVAVNNAGIVNDLAPIEFIARDVAQKVINVDLMGVFYALQAQVPVMSRQFEKSGDGGSIVNLASVAGLVGCASLSIYSAAKHGVVGLTKAAAIENARKGVRVNAVCPAFSRTAMLTQATEHKVRRARVTEEALIKGIPMARVAEIDEITQAILFVAAPENSFMTGETIALDGGLSAV